MTLRRLILACIPLGAIGLAGCDVDVNETGKPPEVNVQETPDVDISPPAVNVDPDPDVVVPTPHVDVDIDRPGDNK